MAQPLERLEPQPVYCLSCNSQNLVSIQLLGTYELGIEHFACYDCHSVTAAFLLMEYMLN
jgi:hypothetical protein